MYTLGSIRSPVLCKESGRHEPVMAAQAAPVDLHPALGRLDSEGPERPAELLSRQARAVHLQPLLQA